MIENIIKKLLDLDSKISKLIQTKQGLNPTFTRTINYDLTNLNEMAEIEGLITELSLFFEKIPELKHNFECLRNVYISEFVSNKEGDE